MEGIGENMFDDNYIPNLTVCIDEMDDFLKHRYDDDLMEDLYEDDYDDLEEIEDREYWANVLSQEV